MNDIRCANCEAELAGHYKYCPECSQKTTLKRLSFQDIVHDAVHYFTHADRGLFTLIRDLATKTGTVAYEYINGRRKRYFPPLNFYLIVAAVMVFALTAQESPQLEQTLERMETSPADGALAEQRIRTLKYALFMNRNSNIVMVLALPVTALGFWIVNRRKGYSYIEHLVACMFMAGFLMLGFALVIVPFFRLFDLPDIAAPTVLFFFQLIYGAVFYQRFINQKVMGGYYRAMAGSVMACVLWFGLTMVVGAIYIGSGFWGLIE